MTSYRATWIVLLLLVTAAAILAAFFRHPVPTRPITGVPH